MKLSVITVNFNNASGLQKTIESVLDQSRLDFEYIIIDGNSSDDSIKTIQNFDYSNIQQFKWISEPDKGIYNAMNKGIRMASGDYIQILNSGDYLFNETVIEQMLQALEKMQYPNIMYGNMIKQLPDRDLRDRSFKGKEITLLDMYSGTLNHSPVYIRRQLFDKYGYYDETLKVVSDWKWYFQAIIYWGEQPVYTDIDVVYFDMKGISSTNVEMVSSEKNYELEKLVPAPILSDYKNYSFYIEQMKRLKRFPLIYNFVWFLERCLAKWERWTSKEQSVK